MLHVELVNKCTKNSQNNRFSKKIKNEKKGRTLMKWKYNILVMA